MKKIMVIGSGGAGKSTFARQLGKKLDIDVYHLDALFWKSGWVGVTKEEQRKVQNDLVKEDKWIIDGNYGGTMDIRLNAADTVIFLDISRFICTARVLKRFFKYRKGTRPDMGEGCKEKLDFNFLKWVWKYPENKRPEILDKISQLPKEKNIFILSSRKEVNDFLETVC